ncbi:ATP-binding cassette domain-containing protein [Enterococcus cecorum]|uniref:ATP-binding cassette domain-containing protein n=1 Tax=Enterococcus cecorum TaxID=44008 RepID=UPI003D78372C
MGCFFAIILDVKIENNGENISGGQKIRLEIARSLLRQKEVLLVDEATASLDPENAKKVHELILSLPLTIIKIAHHIDQKAHYDQIIEIKGCEAA